MKVQMLRAVVAGKQPRTEGEIVDLQDKEAVSLIADGAAKKHVAFVAPEAATIEPAEKAVLPAPKRKQVARGK